MRQFTCLRNGAFALCGMLFWVPIASGQQTSATGTSAGDPAAAGSTAQTTSTSTWQPYQQAHPYICSFYYTDRNAFYRTGVFQTAANLRTLHDAWWNYLTKTYHVSGAAVAHCDQAQADLAGQQYTLTLLDQRAQAAKAVMVVADWKYPPDQAGPTAQAAPAARAAAITPQGVPATVDQIPEPFRPAALAEVSTSKGYCLNNVFISGLLDCDCFSRIVLSYRIAHAKEYRGTLPGSEPDARTGWLPLTTLLLGPLDCSECISDERISNWAAARELKGLIGDWADADKNFLTTCVAKSFLASFRAKPSLGLAPALFNEAGSSCWKQLGH
jgi:hypothetical protein